MSIITMFGFVSLLTKWAALKHSKEAAAHINFNTEEFILWLMLSSTTLPCSLSCYALPAQITLGSHELLLAVRLCTAWALYMGDLPSNFRGRSRISIGDCRWFFGLCRVKYWAPNHYYLRLMSCWYSIWPHTWQHTNTRWRSVSLS